MWLRNLRGRRRGAVTTQTTDTTTSRAGSVECRTVLDSSKQFVQKSKTVRISVLQLLVSYE